MLRIHECWSLVFLIRLNHLMMIKGIIVISYVAVFCVLRQKFYNHSLWITFHA